MKSKRSKACDISVATKRKVWERDGQRCIVCGNHNAMPNGHFRSRSNSGLGVEKNIVTLCLKCHYNYDQTIKRNEIKEYIRNYLKSKYKDWSEDDIIFRK
jgi:5-methylcytosine-specific restriction endonuclease McrA